MRLQTLASRVFAVVALCATPLVGALGYFLVTGSQKDIDFAASERNGLRYIQPLSTLLTLAVDDAPGSGDAQTALKQIDKLHAELSASLRLGDKELEERGRPEIAPARFAATWKDFADQPAGSEGHAKARASAVANLITAITHVGDTSNLILDPDLDSYYAMDIVCVAAPALLARLADVKAGAGSEDRLIQSAMLTQIDWPRITADIDTSLAEDDRSYGPSPSLKARMPAVREPNAQAIGAIADQLRAGDGKATPAALPAAVAATGKLLATANEELDILLAARIAALSTSRTSAIAILLVMVTAAGLASWYVVRRSIVQRVQAAIESAEACSQQLVATAGALAAESEQIAGASTAQAQSLQAISASLEETSAMIKSSAELAQNASGGAGRTQRASADGVAALAAMQGAFGTLQDGGKELAQALEHAQDASREVGQVVKSINDIAFQTNLLALNAAVEAARAGEAGAGFAIVAEEVRKLAQQSAQAVKETSERIEVSMRDSTRASEIAAKVLADIELLLQRAKAVHQTFDSISSEATSTEGAVSSITAATQEQSVGIEQIADAVGEIDTKVQRSVVSADNNATTARTLHDLSGQLREAMGSLQGLVRSK